MAREGLRKSRHKPVSQYLTPQLLLDFAKKEQFKSGDLDRDGLRATLGHTEQRLT